MSVSRSRLSDGYSDGNPNEGTQEVQNSRRPEHYSQYLEEVPREALPRYHGAVVCDRSHYDYGQDQGGAQGYDLARSQEVGSRQDDRCDEVRYPGVDGREASRAGKALRRLSECRRAHG